MRKSGVLMHISSLPGDFSCGSFGDEAKKFIDKISEAGFSYWQVLPFNLVDECNSPYKSYSAFALNPYFIDLPTLHKKGLLTSDELNSARQQQPYSCEFVRLYHTRVELLRKAIPRLSDEYKKKIAEFVDKNKYIEQFCRFMSLKKLNNDKAWNEWTIHEPIAEDVFLWQFIEYELFSQWSDIHAYAKAKNIKIIGDIPIYVAFDSADVWANKEQFLLDEDNKPSCVAGVPPDYFAADGQLWGNPIYNWDYMKANDFAWWKDRLTANLALFDGVRIDHFRAFSAYWSVPSTAKTAKEGKWVKGVGKEFIDAVSEITDNRLIIAEDLGDIDEDVVELVEYSKFPSMRVFQFGFLSDDDSTHKPHNYPKNSIAYTGTHDNNTLLGFVWELNECDRKNMLEYCGYTSPDWNNGYDNILRTIFQSHADTVILPIQDLLGYGSDTRLNIPGKADGNWQFRTTTDQLNSINWNKFKRFNELYKR